MLLGNGAGLKDVVFQTAKGRFNTNMNGKKIELRTVIQNISDKNARQLKFKMWIKHSDGSVATDSSGNPLQTVQTFDIPVWNDKANFWPLGVIWITSKATLIQA